MGTSDLNLIYKIVLNNDHEAFGILIDKYQNDIRGLFYKLTNGDKNLTDDLAQEVFIKIFKHLKGFKASSKFSTWIYRISMNVYYDYQKSLVTNYHAGDETNINELESLENQIDINNALKILTEKERIAIILHYEKGFSHTEIKKIMNQPLGTVKSNILRGKLKLRKFFKNGN